MAEPENPSTRPVSRPDPHSDIPPGPQTASQPNTQANTQAAPQRKPSPLSRTAEPPSLLARIFRRFSHEKLAYFFVLAIYIAGVLLTALLIVQTLTWGLLSSFGRLRMMGMLISFGSLGLLVSRVLAGRYGNQLAALYMPHTLPHAVSARVFMRNFRLSTAKDLTAFLTLHKLHVFSAKNAPAAETAANLSCALEPLFTHNVYLPMTRTYFIKRNRLWFDAREVDALIVSEKEMLAALACPSAAPEQTPGV